LVGGDPGIGKSTLLLQAVAKMAPGLPGLYVTGEESLGQVAGRASRLGLDESGVHALAETAIERILEQAATMRPKLIVADSVQTLWTESLTAAPGSVSQVRESAARLVRYAKETGTAVFLVGHVTKEGGIAGPRVLEHMVTRCCISRANPVRASACCGRSRTASARSTSWACSRWASRASRKSPTRPRSFSPAAAFGSPAAA